MSNFKQLFKDDYSRPIETVVKADDKEHIYTEVKEYVVTNEIQKRITNFFESYNDQATTNGVWISGFFGSGKSHLLKILSYVLENKIENGEALGQIFANKIVDDPKLKADIETSLSKYQSESILFNIDQHAQITSKKDNDAILQVFYKVFYDHQGFFGFAPHVAEMESFLVDEGVYEQFKLEFENEFGKSWIDSRNKYSHPLVEEAIAIACAKAFNKPEDQFEGYLDKLENQLKFSIEDFADRVQKYINGKGKNFRLNFFVDEVGQYIADNVSLMLNLQTITESLDTKCNGRSWVIVTSQQDLEAVIGDETIRQNQDFSKIQGRFAIKIPLTSSNVDEVIEKRLLEKSDAGKVQLSDFYSKEHQNLKTLLSFSEYGVQFVGYEDSEDYVDKFPFVPYQFDLFQQCIKSLSKHNVFQGQNASVGERSMLGVFQEVLKYIPENSSINHLVSFDQLFNGLETALISNAYNSILLANNQLKHNPLAIRILKALFLVKYYDSFKVTLRDVMVLLLDDATVDLSKYAIEVEQALTLLEEQSYIQRKGDFYEYLTDEEKDVEEEIKSTELDPLAIAKSINEYVFDGIIKDSKLKYHLNKQEFEYSRYVDGALMNNREREIKIHIISPDFTQYDQDNYFTGNTVAENGLLFIKLPEDKRLLNEIRMINKTESYIRKANTNASSESVRRILMDKGNQLTERKAGVIRLLEQLIPRSTFYLNGQAYFGSTSNDPKTKILDAFQILVEVAYSDLKLIGTANYDENQLAVIMNRSSVELFGDDDTSLNDAEKRVLLYLERRKQGQELTTLTSLRDKFQMKPYGWKPMATFCIVASLFKRGKIEAKKDYTILDDKAFLKSLDNNTTWNSTTVEIQVEIDPRKLTKLKTLHNDLFNESNVGIDPRTIAQNFKQKLSEELVAVKGYLNQTSTYPFLSVLNSFKDDLDVVHEYDQNKLFEELKSYEDKLLDFKEDTYDAIQEFMSGEQKNIFDSVRQYLNGNTSNFKFVDQQKIDRLKAFYEDPNPYAQNKMRDAKTLMEEIQKEVIEIIDKERQLTIDAYQETMNNLEQDSYFAQLKDNQKDLILIDYRDKLDAFTKERYIESLQLARKTLEEMFTKSMNKIVDFIEKNNPQPYPEESTISDNGSTSTPVVNDPVVKPKSFINKTEVLKLVKFTKVRLENSDDVEAYIEALKNKMIEQINQDKNITL
ncbi:BREX system P-loop protein BrxC [Empedobacter falsenii]|uniref:BREX system P-loop protein BrxC n=1 Tax=Empedobacter falsenii TaxID=343874 RepID=UPI003A805CD1